jgi:hypothetical protein
LRALTPQEFPQLGSLSTFLTPKKLGLIEKYPLRVQPAPMPTSIVWENMNKNSLATLMRHVLTSFVIFVILLASCYATYQAIYHRNNLVRQYPNADCAGFTYWVDYAEPFADKNMMTKYDVVQDELWEYYGNAEGKTGLLPCFCKGVWRQQGMAAMKDYTFFNPQTSTYEYWCQTWVDNYQDVRNWTFLVSITVLAVNVLLRAIVRRLVAFERHESTTSAARSVFMKLFISQLINTGFLVAVINVDWTNLTAPYSYADPNGIWSFFDYDFWRKFVGYPDFTSDWYSNVGVTLMCLFLFNLATPHILPIYEIITNALRSLRDRRWTLNYTITSATTQKVRGRTA